MVLEIGRRVINPWVVVFAGKNSNTFTWMTLATSVGFSLEIIGTALFDPDLGAGSFGK